MIRFVKLISIILGIFLYAHPGYAQDLYNKENSKAFAQYLLRSQQFHLASIELERVNFMEPDNKHTRYQLVMAYRKANELQSGISKIEKWYPQGNPVSTLVREWVRLLLLNHEFPRIQSYLTKPSVIPQAEIGYYQLAAAMLYGDYSKAAEYLSDNQKSNYPGQQNLSVLLKQQQSTKYKHSGLALGLSAVIPGLGKVYSKDWKDGLITLLFIATNTWQAYRGFSKDGITSVYGWIFGTMAVGFYGSNLYGSWKSASDYNLRLNNELHHEIEAAVYNRF